MGLFEKFMRFYMGRVIYTSTRGTSSRRDTEIESQEQCAAIIDCNATHIARGQVLHVRMDEHGRIAKIYRNSEYTKLFTRPNPMMTSQEFKYAMAYQLQLTNLSIAWIKWDGNHPVEVWPIIYLHAKILETNDGGYVVNFSDFDGIKRSVRLEDCIVLRRKYNGVGYVGQSNDSIKQAIDMVNNLDESMGKATSVANKIHGLLRQKNAMLAIKSATETQGDFEKRMNAAAENGGVIALDATEDYTPLNVNAWTANAAQAKQIYERIYTYWRTPMEVVNNTSSEQVNQNYYDSIVEPTWEEMGEAFTRALFTVNEQNYGSKIIVTSSAAAGASWATKLNIINSSKEQGLLTTNEQRELLGYGPVEDGDTRLVSLNYINSKDQSAYQVGSTPTEPSEDEPTEPTENQDEPKEGAKDGKEGTGEEGQADS